MLSCFDGKVEEMISFTRNRKKVNQFRDNFYNGWGDLHKVNIKNIEGDSLIQNTQPSNIGLDTGALLTIILGFFLPNNVNLMRQ